MDQAKSWLILGSLLCLPCGLLSGCYPDEMPFYTPDGKQIVLIANDPVTKAKALWTCDLQNQKYIAHFAPDRWQIEMARKLGDQLWVLCRSEDGTTSFRYDLAGGGFLKSTPPCPEMSNGEWVVSSFMAGYDGRPRLFVPATMPESTGERQYDPDRPQYKVHDFPLTTKASTVDCGRIVPAGRAWSVRCTKKDPNKDEEVKAIEVGVYDDKGKKVCDLVADTPIIRYPDYARISDDTSVIALLLGDHGKYRFFVYDAKSGKQVWSGEDNSLLGTPLITGGEVWTLEPVRPGISDDPRFALVRHTPGKSPGEETRKEVFIYTLGDGNKVTSFAPDPKRENFVVAVDGSQPRLLIVPIRDSVKAMDVDSLDLRDQGNIAKSRPAASRPAIAR